MSRSNGYLNIPGNVIVDTDTYAHCNRTLCIPTPQHMEAIDFHCNIQEIRPPLHTHSHTHTHINTHSHTHTHILEFTLFPRLPPSLHPSIHSTLHPSLLQYLTHVYVYWYFTLTIDLTSLSLSLFSSSQATLFFLSIPLLISQSWPTPPRAGGS